MELRLGNQQRHSITAVLLSAVVVIFGLVLVDVLSNAEPDPFSGQTRAVDAPSVSADLGVSQSNDDLTAGVARSNARFTLNPDVTVIDGDATTSTNAARSTTAAVVVTTLTSETTSTRPPTTATNTTTTTTSTTEPPVTSASSVTSSTTETTRVDPPPTPSTTVVGDETTTTKKCRGNRPDCRQP